MAGARDALRAPRAHRFQNHLMNRFALLVLAALPCLGGCASAPEALQLPTPYTAAAIREANPSGSAVVYRLTDADGGTSRMGLRFVDGDAEGVIVESWLEDDEGREVSAPERGPRATWAELRDHARFDHALAVRTRATCRVPAGFFRGWLYTVLGGPEDEGKVTRYYFADDLPGPPVRLEELKGGQRVSLMELLETR